MKLLRFGRPGAERPGVFVEGRGVVDLGDHLGDYDQEFWESGGIGRVEQLIAGANGGSLSIVDIANIRFGAPIAKPYQVLCIGLNYRAHAEETGFPLPEEPVIFNKGPASVVGPNNDLLLPRGSAKTDWEVELAVVIGATARYLADERAAAACIAGYGISNDLSEREFQLERGGQWVKGKSCEGFNPLGPWLATPDEVVDVQALEMELQVNGRPAQQGTTADMVFGVHHLVWYLSQFMVLEPGDVLNTGTPAGVAMGQTPPRFLAEGDVMELRIEGLGEQRQEVRGSPAAGLPCY